MILLNLNMIQVGNLSLFVSMGAAFNNLYFFFQYICIYMLYISTFILPEEPLWDWKPLLRGSAGQEAVINLQNKIHFSTRPIFTMLFCITVLPFWRIFCVSTFLLTLDSLSGPVLPFSGFLTCWTAAHCHLASINRASLAAVSATPPAGLWGGLDLMLLLLLVLAVTLLRFQPRSQSHPGRPSENILFFLSSVVVHQRHIQTVFTSA